MRSPGQRWSFQYLNRIILMKWYSVFSNFFLKIKMFNFFNYLKTKTVKNFYYLGTRFQSTS